jgi:putative membrane protein
MTTLSGTLAGLVRGALMGVAEVIPGVSGGTVALIVGVYQRLLAAISQGVLAARQVLGLAGARPSLSLGMRTLRSLPWSLLLPVAAGMVTAVVLGARFIEPLLDEHPVRMRALFFGLVLAGSLVPVRMVARTAPGRWRWQDLPPAVLSAALLFWLTGLPPGSIEQPGALLIVGSAAIAICALALPGVSGSFLLLSIGMYAPTIQAVNERNLTYIGLFALGAIVGLGSFVSLLTWLLAHRPRITLVIITGLMLGSLRALWPWQGPDRELLAPGADVPIVVLLALAGMAFVAILLMVERRLGLAEEQAEPDLAH